MNRIIEPDPRSFADAIAVTRASCGPSDRTADQTSPQPLVYLIGNDPKYVI